jgi:transcriptional regulator with XRE-family HTH domain
MHVLDILEQKNMTKYRLSKESGVPFATISDLCGGKTQVHKCSGETLYRLAGALGVGMEALIADAMEHRSSFEVSKSNVCHMVHDRGDMDFVIDTLESDKIRHLYKKRWYPESLYLLAMVDYLCRVNGLPACSNYDDIRSVKLKDAVYPVSILTLCAALKSDHPKRQSWDEAIPEFLRFNIVESEVRNVC